MKKTAIIIVTMLIGLICVGVGSASAGLAGAEWELEYTGLLTHEGDPYNYHIDFRAPLSGDVDTLEVISAYVPSGTRPTIFGDYTGAIMAWDDGYHGYKVQVLGPADWRYDLRITTTVRWNEWGTEQRGQYYDGAWEWTENYGDWVQLDWHDMLIQTKLAVPEPISCISLLIGLVLAARRKFLK